MGQRWFSSPEHRARSNRFLAETIRGRSREILELEDLPDRLIGLVVYERTYRPPYEFEVSLAEVGKELNVSRERARQLQERAIGKIIKNGGRKLRALRECLGERIFEIERISYEENLRSQYRAAFYPGPRNQGGSNG